MHNDYEIHKDTIVNLSPKGIVALNLMHCGMIEDLNDPKIQLFWYSFNEDLKTFGYEIQEVKN